MRQDRSRILLEVIGGQHVVVCCNKRLEVAPCAAGDQSQRPGVGIRDRQVTRDAWGKTDPYGDGRGSNPQDHEWGCYSPGVRPEVSDERGGNCRDDHGSAHATIGGVEIKLGPEVRLSRSDPLEQIPPTDEQTKQRSTDRVEHEPGLMRKKSYQEGAQGSSQPDVLAQRAQVAACLEACATRYNGAENWQQCRHGKRQYDKGGPDERGVAWQHPSGQQGRDTRGCRQRTPQIVQHLPQSEQRQAAAAANGARRVASSKDPRQQLPVTPRPAVLACRSDVVPRWKFLDYLDIRNQSCARKDPLEEIMTEQHAVGYPTGEGRFEGIDMVDALASVRAFTEEILVDIRHGGSVWIDAACAREDALKE